MRMKISRNHFLRMLATACIGFLCGWSSPFWEQLKRVEFVQDGVCEHINKLLNATMATTTEWTTSLQQPLSERPQRTKNTNSAFLTRTIIAGLHQGYEMICWSAIYPPFEITRTWAQSSRQQIRKTKNLPPNNGPVQNSTILVWVNQHFSMSYPLVPGSLRNSSKRFHSKNKKNHLRKVDLCRTAVASRCLMNPHVQYSKLFLNIIALTNKKAKLLKWKNE